MDKLNITYNYLRLFKTKISPSCIKGSCFNSPKTGYPDQFSFSYISRRHNKSGKLLSTQQHQSFDLYKGFSQTIFFSGLEILIFLSSFKLCFAPSTELRVDIFDSKKFWIRTIKNKIKKRPLSLCAVGERN